ncbi:hypothetical protein L2E82_20348 [Cichorium intybus]|uniref:Uncharacterized protein n=1 Tax=Cichorium intybus TaxID=13427 RepID=A0ACB9DT47_CICIN|nr:hypothetical protein L2E82_20348 [Cichorium intybus]
MNIQSMMEMESLRKEFISKSMAIKMEAMLISSMFGLVLQRMINKIILYRVGHDNIKKNDNINKKNDNINKKGSLGYGVVFSPDDSPIDQSVESAIVDDFGTSIDLVSSVCRQLDGVAGATGPPENTSLLRVRDLVIEMTCTYSDEPSHADRLEMVVWVFDSQKG